jgi:hypothetical protein
MKKFISDRHIVVVLFIMVFVTFSLAHEDSKDLENFYSGFKPLPHAEKTAVAKSPAGNNQPAGSSEKSFTQATSLR